MKRCRGKNSCQSKILLISNVDIMVECRKFGPEFERFMQCGNLFCDFSTGCKYPFVPFTKDRFIFDHFH